MSDKTRIPTVSVVIPMFNRAHTIRRALDSVLAQTYQDFEVIVVDDASTDESAGVVTAVADERVVLVSHGVNKGEAGARNTGVRKGRARYVAFLDSDDEWLPTKLQRQLDFLRQNPRCQGACSEFYRVRSDLPPSRATRRERFPHPQSWHKQLLLSCGLGMGTTFLCERSLFDEVGEYDTSLPRYTDWDWMLRFVKGHELGIIYEPLALVHYDPSGSSKVVTAATYRFIEKHSEDFARLAPLYRREALAMRWLEVAHYCYKDGLWLPCASYIAKAFAQHPLIAARSAVRVVLRRLREAYWRRRGADRLSEPSSEPGSGL